MMRLAESKGKKDFYLRHMKHPSLDIKLQFKILKYTEVESVLDEYYMRKKKKHSPNNNRCVCVCVCVFGPWNV